MPTYSCQRGHVWSTQDDDNSSCPQCAVDEHQRAISNSKQADYIQKAVEKAIENSIPKIIAAILSHKG